MNLLLAFLFVPACSYAGESQSKAFSQLLNITAQIEPVSVPIPASVPSFEKARKLGFKNLPPYTFSDGADISNLLVSAINSSTVSVDVAIYGITLENVAEALVKAQKRRVAVRVIINESHVFHSKVSQALQTLIDGGVNLRTLRGLGKYGIMHNKVAVFDSKIVVTGSYNWTVTANTANYENIIFTYAPNIINGYSKYFRWMWKYSRPLKDGPAGEYPPGHVGVPPVDPSPSVELNGLILPSYSFSPAGTTEEYVIKAINAAQSSLDVAVFSFYSDNIAAAVINAKKRGVEVRVVTDKVQASQSYTVRELIENGVQLRWSRGFAGQGVMHNKFAVVDGKMLMTGSFNWSLNAQLNNFENMFYTVDPDFVGGYLAEFDKIYRQALVPAKADLEGAPREIFEGSKSFGFHLTAPDSDPIQE